MNEAFVLFINALDCSRNQPYQCSVGINVFLKEANSKCKGHYDHSLDKRETSYDHSLGKRETSYEHSLDKSEPYATWVNISA